MKIRRYARESEESTTARVLEDRGSGEEGFIGSGIRTRWTSNWGHMKWKGTDGEIGGNVHHNTYDSM